MNDFQWTRQGFDRNHRRPITDHFGIYATSPTCYLSLLARRPHFERSHLDDALYTKRELVRVRAMRYSVFLVSTAILPTIFQAYRANEDDVKKRAEKYGGITPEELKMVSAQVEELLDDNTMTAKELKDAIPDLSPAAQKGFQFIIPIMNAEGRTLRAKVRGGWKSDQFTYARLDRWIPDVDLSTISPEDTGIKLARLYFQQYAPATFEDFRWWSGYKKKEATAAFDALQSELLALEDGYYILAEDQAAYEDAPAADGLRLLPIWDAYLMAYKDRSRYLDPAFYNHVYDKAGNATSVILWDGRVAGIWDTEDAGTDLTVKVFWFDDPLSDVYDLLEDEVKLIAALGEYDSTEIIEIQNAPPITDSGQNRFMSPLKGT